MKKSNKRLILKCLCLLSFISILTTVIVVCCLNKSSVFSPEFVNINKVYSGTEKEITNAEYTPSTKYTPISEVVEANLSTYQGSGDDKKVISISTSDDLSLLSSNCYNNSEYLKCNYELLNNITYTSTSYFIPLGWQASGTTLNFSGSFNGNGYDITNLKFQIINASSKSTYSGNEYFAFVAKNSGIIKNVGLVEPTIAISDLMDSLANNGVANLCGLNSGTIDSCYVRQLNRTIEEECGITALGGYRVSGLVIENTSNISNTYLATNSIYNRTCNDIIEFADIALTNSGTLTNVYFYNSSIDQATSTFTNGGSYNFKYVTELGNTRGKNGTNYPGDWVRSLSELRDKFTTWTYNVGSVYTYVTPVKRTITLTNNVFNVTSVNDLVMLYELINLNAVVASNTYTYSIEADLDLSYISSDVFKYSRGIGATITGENYNSNSTTTLITGERNNYPTIYNLDITNSSRYVTNLGVDAYGFIPYFTGNMSKLNFYYSTDLNLDNLPTTSNLTAFGAVVGYLENGSIENVNVYANITSSTSNKLKECLIGGLCGIVGESTLKNITTNGSISLASINTFTKSNTYAQGVSVGGVVGFSENTYSSLSQVLNAMNVSINANTNHDYSVAGILGGGYVTNTNKLENKGSITVASASNYTSLYTSGVIARLLGIRNQINELTNQGTITTYLSNANSYVSGILNADIIQTASNSFTRSEFVNNSNQCLFYASSLTNRANVEINNSCANLYYTSGINVLSSNGFISQVSNLYNLAYTETYRKNSTTGKYTTGLNAQTIDMAKTPKYAGLVNNIVSSDSNSVSGTLDLSQSYNLRDITFTDSSSISTDMYYAAVARGENINYSNIYNEGKLTFTVSKGISTLKSLNVSGVFEELNNGFTAQNIFNGADITFTDNATATLKLDLNIAGIVLNDESVDNSTSQNPTKSDFDKESIGTLDNAINNGNIKVTSSKLDKTMTSASSTTVTTITFPVLTSNTKLDGNINVSGITIKNNGIISNTFNLGDINLEVFALNSLTYNAAGIACELDGQYASIKNCANNGDISVINMANMVTSSSTDNQPSSYYREYVSGIVGINNTNSTNVNEVISFTINYGTIKGYAGYVNPVTNTSNNSYVAGILAYGACNIVNVLNYGNIYGSEVAGSICGKLDLANTSSDTVYLANTINYGNIKLLKHYNVNGTTITNASFTDIENLDSKYISVGTYGTIDTYNYAFVGAMFGIVDFASGNYANLNIRYVLNFYQGQSITQTRHQLNSYTIDTTTFMTCKDANDTFGGSSIKYAPLSTISDSAGNVGVFSSDFIFRKAINKDSTAVDYTNYITDKYITDYFSFVVYDKVNTNLLEKIGWRNVAYLTAAEELARNVSAMTRFVSYGGYSKTDISNITTSFSSDTWTTNIDSTLLNNAIVEILGNSELTSKYQDIINYFLFDTTYTSSVYQSIKDNIISSIITCLDTDNVNYQDLIQKLLYDEVLAKIVAGDDADYKEVQTEINLLLSNISQTELRTIITNYLNNINSDSTILDNLFDNDSNNYYTLAKYNLVNTILEGYSDDTITLLTDTIMGTDSTSKNALKYYEYLKNNESISKELYTNILSSNSSSTELETLLNKAFKSYSTEVTNSIDSATTSTNNFTDKTGSEYINGSSVSYTKDYTELWNIVKNYDSFKSYLTNESGLFNEVTDPTSSIKYNAVIAKATEYNSTYQTLNEPVVATNKTGKTRSDKTKNGNERYIYTPDDLVNDKTYYYGPFDSSGKLLNISYGWSDKSNYNADIYNASNVSGNTNFYTPFFISLDETTRTNYINQSNTNSTVKSLGTYYWNDGQNDSNQAENQWVSDYIIENVPSNCKYFLQKFSGSGEYYRNGYNYSPNYTAGDADKTTQTTTTDGHNQLKDNYVTGYGTSQVYTGIWYPVSIWYSNEKVNGVYLTATSSQSFEGSYKGIFTTQYTYYTIDDLINLDGIRTKGKSTGSEDADEIAVISAIMTRVLANTNGNKAVLSALAEYASTESFTSSQHASMIYLASALNSSEFASKFSSEVVSLQSDTVLKNLSYRNTSLTTVYLKLEDLIKDQSFTSKQALAFYISNNKEAFIKLLNYSLTDFSDYDNDDGTNIITSNDFTYHLATYISYLKSQNSNITASEIVSLINTANSTDIEYLKTLDDLDYSSWINNASITHEDTGYGTSTDIKALGDLSKNEIGANIAYPFKWESTTFVTNSNSNKQTKFYGSYSGNVSYISKTVQASTKGNNIGYFIGSDLKIYTVTPSYTDFYYPDNNSEIESHKLPYTNGTVTYNAPDNDVKSYLAENGSYLLRLSSNSPITTNGPSSRNSYNLIADAQVGSWTGTALVPKRSIWLVPVKVGVLKFVVYNTDSADCSFSIKRLTRSTPNDYSTAFKNYENMITYSNLKKGKAYYFEYAISQTDIEEGYEYAIVCDNTETAPFFAYIDLGDTASVASEFPDLSTIESNYNTYYNSGNALSSFANTILAKDMITVNYKSDTLIGTTQRTITVSSPTIMLVNTSTTNIPITVTGDTTYNNSSGTSVTVSKVTINSKEGYTAFYLSGGTYNVSATSDTISEILLVNKASEFTTSTDSNNLLHVKFNGKDILSGISNYTDLQSYKLNVSQSLLDTLKVIYPTIKETSGIITKYSIFDKFSANECKKIIEKLVNADDDSSSSSLGKLIAEASSHYQYILDNVESSEAKLNILNKVIDIEGNANDGTYPKTQDTIIASFIGQNYLNYSTANSLKSSTLYTLLNTYQSGKYQFITGDTSIDYDKFDAFLAHLGVTSSMSGYGIYALSSSLGKKNGIFIPDNFDLTSMDANYKKSSNYLVIDEDTSSYWRDLTANTTTTYDVSNTNSVNYKFRNEMKQLKLSISTEILKADITSEGYTIYATDTTIDSTNGIIYYYVPSSYIDYLKIQSNASVDLSVAASATCTTKTIDFTKGSFNEEGYYVVPNSILVTAEDTTVTTNYSIYLVPRDITIDSFTTSKNNIASSGEMIEFSITTTNAPDNFDLTPYLTVNGVYLSDTNKKFYLDETLYNNGVVVNNTATMRLYIEESHIGGNIPLVISVYGSSKSVNLNKTKSLSATLSIEFEGNSVSFDSSKVATSLIKVGRIYTKEELSTLAYLSDYTFASNSTHTVSVTYNNTTLANERYQYIVTITVTSEDESSTVTYTHKLNEMDYFDSTYANIYKDGNIVNDLYTQEFISGDNTYNDETGNTTSLTYSDTNNNFAAVSFTRGNEYEYRIKYVLNNFYLTEGAEFSVDSYSSGCSVITPSAGMTVVVGNTQELGVYYFNYKYTHTVQFDSETQITREYIFPTLFVIKKEGEDALLHRITFLESEEIIGNTATIIQADTRKTSETNKQSAIYIINNNVVNSDGYETTYSDQSSSNTHYISVTNNSTNTDNISYGTLASGTSTTDTSITDYYAIGTVNEAELSYYSPIFGINDYAQMYQYTTRRKLQEYGNTTLSGSTYSDANILGDHTSTNTNYLYVPFEYTIDGETLYQIFYVELDSDFKWTNIYDISSDPTNTDNSIATFENNGSGITTKEATDDTKASFTYNGITYTVSSSAGKPTENMSLYMDYIGSPLAEHFWYVSYMVMSEAMVSGDTANGNVRYYHISIIDSTNNIYFECKLYSTEDLGSEVYMTISENIYSGTIKKSSKQISGHFYNKEVLTTKKTLTYNETTNEYLYLYTLRYKLSTLPKGYFSFYLDLKNGYSVSATTSDSNQLVSTSEPGKSEEGTFLPYTSIITRTIKLNFYVNTTNNASQVWGVKKGNIFTYKASYIGKEENDSIQ